MNTTTGNFRGRGRDVGIHAQPDFQRFKNTLTLQQAYRRPPLFDFIIDNSHKQAILGRPVETAADNVAFYAKAGYDYVQASVYPPVVELGQAVAAQKNKEHTASHGTSQAVIQSFDHYKSKRWSWQPVAEGDLTAIEPALRNLEQTAAAVPESMRVLFHTADVFTFAWEMIGFTELCLASFEQPDWLEAVMQSLGDAVRNCVRESIRRVGDRIGAIIYSDDIAYTEGLMLCPDFFRKMLFPIINDIVDMGRAIDAPLIYHSDGRLYDVFDDLAAIGVRGVQPLEPKSMEPLQIKNRWPGKFCLLGNIDLDMMSRGSPDQVRAYVRNKIDTLNVGGGYMPGVSNTVPYYVNLDNYITMIQTVYEYGE
ncbi:MAG: uroporphyrinogen decarboxylase family protein [Phycisphaerales bacterium]